MNPAVSEPHAPADTGGTLPRIVALGCLVLPWINPFAPGPSAAVGPYLVSVACAAVLWVVLGREQWRRDDRAALIAAGWALAAAISTLIGLCQYFGVAESLSPWMNAPGAGQAYANLRQRNQFASLTVIGLAALLWWEGRGARRPVLMAGAVLLAVGCAASTSRTGLLQLGVLIGLTILWPHAHRTRRMQLCLLAAGSYFAAAVLLPRILYFTHGLEIADIWGRMTTSEGCASRTVLWRNVVYLIGQKPLLGWGWGQLDYAHYMTLYPQTRFCDILDNAHNLPLHLAVELGLPIALALLGGLAVWVARARPWAQRDGTRQLAWAVLAVIGVHSLLEYPLWYGPFELAALLAVVLLMPEPPARPAAPSAVAKLRLPVAMLVLAATLYAGWEYRRVSQIYLPYEARLDAYREDTLEKVRAARLFRDQARFAELTLTELTRNNAQWTFDTAKDLLRYSPEPRVVEKVIESATLLERYDEAVEHLARFRAAFPEAHQDWRKRRELPPTSVLGRQPA
jgi:O-antigen ligase